MAKKKYQGEDGLVYSLSLSAKKAAVANNTEPTGNVTSNVKPKISKSARESGIKPRGVILTKELTATQGEVTVTKTVRTFLPILTKAVLDGDKFKKGTAVTYDGASWTVQAQVQEDY